ncbi:MAG: hypothetical protein QNK04_32315 [Myxococcota bacterium]|nr:hypothetical protein [Myxococcota bacterium]
MSLHPLVELSLGGEVRKAAGFKAAAAALNGEGLASQYQAEIANAPSRHGAGKKYLVAYNSRLASARKPARDSEHLCLALVDHCRREGAGLALPDEAGDVHFVHAHLPVKSAQEDKARGAEDPNRGLLPIDLLGIGPEERMVLARVKFVAPEATRAGTGETPLRALLEGLASAAIATANRADLGQEVAERVGRSFSDQPPLLLILGSPRYWELCRKREAQKGAAWIQEIERLAREVGEQTGVDVMFVGCRLGGDPGWSYSEGTPVLDEAPRLMRAWELGAGRVRPKPKPRPKQAAPSETLVEPDLSRPVRPYVFTESFAAGDRIEHPKLGLGVVQGVAGTGKINVLFGDKRSVLVHERRP